jgi:tetratricopeptide (TPR) repeat protein
MTYLKIIIPLFICTVLITLGFFFSGHTYASGYLVSERTYKRLDVIHNLMADDKYVEAKQRLEQLQQSTKNNHYESALVLQTYAYLYAAKDDYQNAIIALEKCLSLDAMPDAQTHKIHLNLIQLYVGTEKYKKAINTFEKYLIEVKSPSAYAHGIGGIAYAQLNNYPKAIKHLKIAIANSKKPEESWFQMLLSIYYDRKEYAAAAEVLENLIVLYPDKKEYWKQLSGVRYQLHDDDKALSVLQLAYLKGLLQEENELINLAKFYAFQGMPYKGALVIETGINYKIIKPENNILQLLAECYLRANELGKAIMALTKAAEASNDANLYIKLAHLHYETEDWPATTETIKKALEIGKVENLGTVYLLQGIAFYEQGKFEQAITALDNAKKYQNTSSTAEQWLAYVSNQNVLP